MTNQDGRPDALLVTQMDELRHRLRNHLQNMISLISMQIRRARSEETIAALEDLRARFASITSIYIDLDDSSDHPVALEKFVPASIAVDVAHPPDGVNVEGTMEHNGKSYTLLNVIGSTTIAEGKYLANPETGQVELQWIQGIGSQDAPAPQARLMSVVINGILNRKLPWGLVLLGVFLVIAVELLGIRSLSFAVGSYLSIGTTAAIFCGGIVRWLVERNAKTKTDDEASPGALYASGLIAAGGIVGLLAICVKLLAAAQEKVSWLGWFPTQWGKVGEAIGVAGNSALGMVAFAALAFSLFYFARKPLETAPPTTSEDRTTR